MTQTNEKVWVLPDTNVLLQSPNALENYNLIIIGCVLREVEKHKSSPRKELAYQARIATRYIKNRIKEDAGSVKFIGEDFDAETILGSEFHNAYFDNQIVAAGLTLKAVIASYDILLQFKAQSFDVDIIELDEDFEDDTSSYTGIRELYLSHSNEEDTQLLANIYESPELNTLNLVQNEYLLIWDKDKKTYTDEGEVSGYEMIDVLRFDGFKLIKLKFKPTQDKQMGKTKPLNVKQQIAFDLLQNKDIGVSLILGNAGGGKDFLMTAHMMQALERQEIDKIVFIRNIQPLENAEKTGFLPGDLNTKMLSWSSPIIDAIGGEFIFQQFVEAGKIEIQHFEAIRGRSFNNVGLYCTEIQNMTENHARMLLSRVGQGSYIYLNGDTKQVDAEVFRRNSAINALKRLKGHRLFGLVTLDKTERSEIASLSELI
jgi:predicted ribonuclease YlaK